MSRRRLSRRDFSDGRRHEESEQPEAEATSDVRKVEGELFEAADRPLLSPRDLSTLDDDDALDAVKPYKREHQPVHDFGVGTVDYLSPEDFNSKGATEDDFKWCVIALDSVVKPRVHRGWERSDFERMDEEVPESPAENADRPLRSYAKVHDLFYGEDKIVLHREPDGTLGVTNGRHRIEAARQLGIDTLPGHLLEPPREKSPEDELEDLRISLEDYEKNWTPTEKRDNLLDKLHGLPWTSEGLKQIPGVEFNAEHRQCHVYIDEQYNPAAWKRHIHLTFEILEIHADHVLMDISNISYTNRHIPALVVESLHRREGFTGIVPEVHIRQGLDDIAEMFREYADKEYQRPSTKAPTLTNIRHNSGERCVENMRSYDKLSRLLDAKAAQLKNTDGEYSAETLSAIRHVVDAAVDAALVHLGESRVAQQLHGNDAERKSMLRELSAELHAEIEARRRRIPRN